MIPVLLALLLAGPAGAAAPRSLPVLPPLAGALSGAAVPASLPDARPGLPWYIRVADADDARWLAEVLKASERSPTARATLREVEKTASRLARPIVIETQQVRVESFNYDWDVVTLKTSLKNGDLLAVPSILMHELTHFVQKNRGLPADAFEHELDAYIVDTKVTLELGHRPPKGSWEAKRLRKFRGDLDSYIGWLKAELYEDDLFLSRMGLRAYRRELEDRLKGTQSRIPRVAKRLEKARSVLRAMEETGQDPLSMDNYRRDVLARHERAFIGETVLQNWLRLDLKRLESPALRRQFSAYARSVMRRLERLHRRYQDQ